MEADNTRRVVVIRDIQSNIVEEAILVLRSKPDDRAQSPSGKEKNGKCEADHAFMLREAELIIANYIENSQASGTKKQEKEKNRRIRALLKWLRRPEILPVVFLSAGLVLLVCVVLFVF